MTNRHTKPPQWVKKIFEWYCSYAVAEDLLGDMDELYWSNVRKMPVYKAKWKYVLQAMTLIFSYGVRIRKHRRRGAPESYHSFAMYRSYSIIAVRALAKQKTFTAINIVCLAVGMSIGLIALAAWVDVLQVDQFHTKKEEIYRINTIADDQGDRITFASSHHLLAERIKAEGAAVEEVVSLNKTFRPEVVLSAAVSVPVKNGYFVSDNFFDVFDFPFSSGNKATALKRPFQIVLSQEMANKLYQDGQALGKMLELKGQGMFEVTGVVATHPRSHFFFDVLTSMSTLESLEQQGSVEPTLFSVEASTPNYTYLLLRKGSDVASLEPLLGRVGSEVQRLAGNKVNISYQFQQLTDIPMSDHNNEIGLAWGYVSMVVFFFLSLLVLLPACFNYTNISIARALKRAKEIGVRKVSGGESRHIFIQMVLETIIISIVSLGGALMIFSVVRDQFLQLVVNGHQTFSLEITPVTLTIFIAFAIFTGFVAGILPASYFAKLNPIETLRNASSSGKISKVNIRKSLIVVQFALSLVFILGVAIVVKQYRFALNYNFGFNKENILDVQLKGVDEEVFRSQMATIRDVASVSMSSSIAGNWGASGIFVKINDGRDSLETFQMFVDENYIQNLQLSMLAGTSMHDGQEGAVVVNEAFLKKNAIQAPHEALGKSFEIEGQAVSIVGVAKDFNFMPLTEQIQPFVLRSRAGAYQFANIKLQSDDIQNSISEIEAAWYKITDQRFDAQFLEHELDDSLTSFRSMVKIFGFLGLLAITISSLGLLAVVISSAESRMKEMGIRKVFGASKANMMISLGSGFLRLIVIAVVIATPITYLLFDVVFLRMYFYRASIGLVEIGAGIVFLLILVAIIVGSQGFRVTRVNPVDILKYE